MQNFQGSDWHRLIPAVQYCDFRRSSLDARIGNSITLNNGFPVMTGKFSQGIYLGGQSYQSTNKANYLTFSRGTQISGNNYTNYNANQGTISFWVKPYLENSQVQYFILDSSTSQQRIWINSFGINININGTSFSGGASSFTVGSWHHVVIRWSVNYVVSTTYYIQ